MKIIKTKILRALIIVNNNLMITHKYENIQRRLLQGIIKIKIKKVTLILKY